MTGTTLPKIVTIPLAILVLCVAAIGLAYLSVGFAWVVTNFVVQAVSFVLNGSLTGIVGWTMMWTRAGLAFSVVVAVWLIGLIINEKN